MTYLAASAGTVSLFGQDISAWTAIVLLIGIIVRIVIRGKVG